MLTTCFKNLFKKMRKNGVFGLLIKSVKPYKLLTHLFPFVLGGRERVYWERMS